jgi:DNA polymerase III epsilon subunit-like protein
MPSAASLSFTAIDFETANTFPNSACAIGLVRVEKGRSSLAHTT